MSTAQATIADGTRPNRSEEAALRGGVSPTVTQATIAVGVIPALTSEAPGVAEVSPPSQLVAGAANALTHGPPATMVAGISPAPFAMPTPLEPTLRQNPFLKEPVMEDRAVLDLFASISVSFSRQTRDFEGFPPMPNAQTQLCKAPPGRCVESLPSSGNRDFRCRRRTPLQSQQNSVSGQVKDLLEQLLSDRASHVPQGPLVNRF